MKNLLLGIFLILFFLFSNTSVFSKSDYVLPYPSFMPGTIFYKLHLAFEWIEKYWYFGDFGQFYYNLKQSDKYLVEAKTLFEYNQYLLGFQALEKSNFYFKQIPQYLLNAKLLHNKNISEKEIILQSASLRHKEVLSYLREIIPPTFYWTPEKDKPTLLNLHEAINNSIHTVSE